MTGSTHQSGYQRDAGLEIVPAPYAAPHRAHAAAGGAPALGGVSRGEPAWAMVLAPYAPGFPAPSPGVPTSPLVRAAAPGAPATVPEAQAQVDGLELSEGSVGSTRPSLAVWAPDAGTDELPWIEVFAPDPAPPPSERDGTPDGAAPAGPGLDAALVDNGAAIEPAPDTSLVDAARTPDQGGAGVAHDVAIHDVAAHDVAAHDVAAHGAEGDEAAATAGSESPRPPSPAAAVPGGREEASGDAEGWPMDEIGARLHELAQSLPLLDEPALRPAINGGTALGRGPGAAPSVLPMWSEDEWVDIMPASRTPAAEPTLAGESAAAGAAGQARPSVNEGGVRTNTTPAEDAVLQASAGGTSAAETPAAGVAAAVEAPLEAVELTARALEGLADRVRAGGVPVPAFQPDTGEPAMLAGVLAALLGWRQ